MHKSWLPAAQGGAAQGASTLSKAGVDVSINGFKEIAAATKASGGVEGKLVKFERVGPNPDAPRPIDVPNHVPVGGSQYVKSATIQANTTVELSESITLQSGKVIPKGSIVTVSDDTMKVVYADGRSELASYSKVNTPPLLLTDGTKGLGQTGGAVTSGTTLDLFSATRGKDLSKLTNQQVGDLGEDISKVFLRDNNHTDIFAVQNRSGNGIDIVSRTPDGRLAFTEVKTSRTGNVGDLSVRQQNMTTFIEDVLGQAASRQGRYKSISVAEQQQARQMLREFRRAPENVSGNLIGVDLQGEVLRVSPWARN